MTKKRKQKLPKVDPAFRAEIERRFSQEAVDLSDLPDEVRISSRLIDLVAPYADGSIDRLLLYDCATIAWNECAKEDHGEETKYVLNNMVLNYTNYRELIDQLKMRKRAMFADDRRCIAKVKIYVKGNGGMTVNVASSMDMDIMVKAAMERFKRIK